MIIHLITEIIEKKKHHNGTVETFENHLGDMTYFFFGWIFADYFNDKFPDNLRLPILLSVIISTFREIGREIFLPDNFYMKGFFY